jgi:hypothetical protein
MPLRHIVNCILSPTYGLAKHLAGLLKPLVGNSVHHIRNSEVFIQKLNEIQLQEKALFNELQCDLIIHQSTTRGHAASVVQHIPVEIKDLIRHPLMLYTLYLMEHSMNRLIVSLWNHR